jgi:hypothetical protein
MLLILKKYLVVLICIIPTFAWGGTQTGDGPKILLSYTPPKLHSNLQLYKEWKTEKDLIPGEYRLKANIHLKTILHPVEFDALDLTPKSSADGMKLTQTFDEEIKIDDFDELQIDYQDMVPDNPSLIRLQLVLSGEKLKGNTTSVMIKGEENQFVPSTLSELDSSPWEKKDYYYIARRWLQLPFDSSWQYILKPEEIFFQKRFHHDFSSVEAVDIVFKPEASFKEVNSLNCNLRFNYESKLWPSKIVECANFPQRLIKTRGKLIRRLFVGNEIRSRYMKNGVVNLSEIIFISPTNTIDSIQAQPVESIILQSLPFQESLEEEKVAPGTDGKIKPKPVYYFSSSLEGPLGQRKRLALPLRQFIENVGKNGRIHSLTLSIKPKSSKSPHEFHLNRLRAVNFKEEERLSILYIGEKLNTRWGNPVFNLENNDGKIERVQVNEYMPFYSLEINQEELSQIKNSSTIDTGAANQQNSTETVDFAGTQIRTQNYFSNWRSDKNGLQLTGKGSWVEIDWPTRLKLDKNTQLFLGIDEKASYIDSILTLPIVHGKTLLPFFLQPNKAKELKGLSGEIDGFKIRLNFPSNKFNIRLKEFAIIRPQRIPQDQILETPIFFDEETTLFPKNIQSFPKRKVEVVSGHLGALLFASKSMTNEISWETEVGRKATWIQGLKVVYKIFPQIKLDNPCWLKFTLLTSKRQINHTLCPDESSDQVIIPRKVLLKNADFQANEVLENIVWKIQTKAKNIPQPFSPQIDIGINLIGQYSRTIPNELTQYPVVNLNDIPIFAKGSNQVSTQKILSGKFRINLGSMALNYKNHFNVIKHPYFNATSFVLEKVEPLSMSEFETFSQELSTQSDIQQNKNLTKEALTQTVSYQNFIFFFLIVVSMGWLIKHPDFFHRLQEWLKLSPDTAQRQFFFFASVATVFYLLAQYFSMIRWHLLEETFLSLAGLPILLATRVVLWWIRPHLESKWPVFASHVYRGPGTPYIASFFPTFALAIFFVVFPVNVLAEHIGVNSFYMLVVGVYLETRALRKESAKPQIEDAEIETVNEVKRA